MHGISELAKWLRISKRTVHRNLRTVWKEMPKTILKRGQLNDYKFNKKDVWSWFKKTFN